MGERRVAVAKKEEMNELSNGVQAACTLIKEAGNAPVLATIRMFIYQLLQQTSTSGDSIENLNKSKSKII